MPQQDNLSPEKVVNDPAFLQLPAQEQKKVLLKIDPAFKALPEMQQNLVVQRLHFPQPTKPLPDQSNQDGPLSVATGFGKRAKDTVKGLYHMVTDDPTAEEKQKYGEHSFDMQGRAALPLARIKEGFVSGEKEAAKQTAESARGTRDFAKDKQFGAAAVQAGKTAVTAASMADPFATSSVANVNELQAQGKPWQAAGEGLFDAMTLAIGSKWAKGKLPNTGTLSRLSKLAPKVVDVEGVKFIVPISEAEESAVASKAGMKQAQFKKAGIGAKEFDEINRYNQAAAREVIRKVAQKTSGMTGPMGEAAGQATKQAGDAVLDAARPMYKALDAALQGPPEMRVVAMNMSKAVQRAMKKVEGFGAKSLGKGSMTQPLETYLQAKSSIMGTLRQTRDPIVRRGLENALDEMNDVVEKEMKSSGIPDMYENFQEANRLWAKGKAIQRVGEAIEKATPGVPTNMQNQGLSPRPPAIKPASLMQQLKKLDAKGDLTRGFGDTQKQALYKVADILDRQAPVGMPSPGESALFKAIKHMAAGPYRHTLVKIMTSPQGAAVINNLAAASIPSKVAMYSAQLSRMADSANAEKWLPGQVQPPPGAQPTTQ